MSVPAAIEGSQVTTGSDLALHNLCNVLRDIVHKSPHVYHDELQQLNARKAIDEYEEKVYGALRLNEEIKRYTDRAGHEDVNDRVPPPVNPAAPVETIDYDKLAAALAARGLALPAGSGPAISGEVISNPAPGGAVSL
jgi:hypothetical protein